MFWRKNKEFKYYTLEELKVGMRVAVRSLDTIYQQGIYLDKKTFKNDSYGGSGTIVAIGLQDYLARGLKRSEVYVISNAYDLTDESISEDTIEYDLEEWLERQKQDEKIT